MTPLLTWKRSLGDMGPDRGWAPAAPLRGSPDAAGVVVARWCGAGDRDLGGDLAARGDLGDLGDDLGDRGVLGDLARCRSSAGGRRTRVRDGRSSSSSRGACLSTGGG